MDGEGGRPLHGIGHARAAITVVNALPAGIGAAVGIGLEAVAEVELVPELAGPPRLTLSGEGTLTPLVSETLHATLRALDPGRGYSLTLGLRSAIPQGKGLKSSSAISCAAALATARALGREPSPLEVARLSARASLKVGVSATGALDDALASLVSGLVVTDNSRMSVLRHLPLDPDWRVALYIPPGTHAPSPGLRERFRREEGRSRRAADAVLHGDLAQAMERNSEIVEEVMGYPYAQLRASTRARGAVAQGVSGMGPAFAALAPSGVIDEVLSALPPRGGDRMTTPLSPGILNLGDERL